MHKEGDPIRPVVSFVTAPSYKLSKRLITLLQIYTKFQPKYSIKNSIELVNNIKDINIPNNAILLSFDVKNLFPSVPPTQVIGLTRNLLVKNRCNETIREDLIYAFKTCLEQNYFEFNSKIYTDGNSLAMGNPLSPVSAEIFMDDLESKIEKHPLFSRFIFWYRYVDDIFACFLGTSRQLTTFFKHINKLHPNITFTMEREANNSINFLDLTITKIENKLSFSIFHKPTHTDMIIHKNSLHPYTHKLASFHCYIHRLLNIPLSPIDYEKELQIIKQIAVNNGYQPTLIDQMLDKKLYKRALKSVYPVQKKVQKFFTLTYIGKPSDIIRKHLRFKDINVSFRTCNTLGIHIENNKSQTEKKRKSGVYELQCGTCDKIYIGQTGRSFKERIDEHSRSYRLKNRKSNFANHFLDNPNHIYTDDFKLLHTVDKGLKLNALESLEINKRKFGDVLLNDQVDLNSSPLLNLF